MMSPGVPVGAQHEEGSPGDRRHVPGESGPGLRGAQRHLQAAPGAARGPGRPALLRDLPVQGLQLRGRGLPAEGGFGLQ